MKQLLVVVGIAVFARPVGAAPNEDKDWAFEQNQGDGELESEFNPEFGTKAVVVLDHNLHHWTSLHNMYESCQGSGPGSFVLQSLGQMVKWGKKFKTIHDGMKSIKTITIKDGKENKVTITATTIDMELGGCSLVSYSTEESAKALMAAFPEAMFEEAEQDAAPHVVDFADKCGSAAKFVLDRKIDDKALRDAYGIGMKSVCVNALDFAAKACSSNPKIKEAFSKVKTFTCTDTGKAAEWGFKLTKDGFTEVVSNKPLSHRTFNLFLEKSIPGAKPAWTVDRNEVEGN